MIVRDHPKLREIWPPGPVSSLRHGSRFPEGERDVLQQVFYYAPVAQADADIALRTTYEGQDFTRDLFLSDAAFAEKLAFWFRKHTGRTIREIGEIELGL